MGAYLVRDDQIGFESPGDSGDNWVRVDADPDGVTFDRAGLCKLDRLDVQQLIEWLTQASDRLPVPTAVKAPKRGRRRRELCA